MSGYKIEVEDDEEGDKYSCIPVSLKSQVPIRDTCKEKK